MAKVDPIPSNYPRVTPYLIVDGAADAIDFYCRVLGATERGRMPGPDGKIGHAELELGDSLIMLADAFPEMGAKSAKAIGDTPVTIMVYVEDVDGVFARAINAGAKVVQPAEDQFWGDRMGTVVDPFGHKWMLGTHIEDVPPDEMEKRGKQWLADMQKNTSGPH